MSPEIQLELEELSGIEKNPDQQASISNYSWIPTPPPPLLPPPPLYQPPPQPPRPTVTPPTTPTAPSQQQQHQHQQQQQQNQQHILDALNRQQQQQHTSNSLRYNANNPQTMEANPDETGRTIRIPQVPGEKTYCEAVINALKQPGNDSFTDKEREAKIEQLKKAGEVKERKTMVFSSSITRGINPRKFNEDFNKGKVEFHKFNGKKAQFIKSYSLTHLEDDYVNTAVMVAGGNDLPYKSATTKELSDVANHIIEGGKRWKDSYGVTNVVISSVLPRKNSLFQNNRHTLNIMLKELCVMNNFIFIENDDILLKPHVHHDGVHLNDTGTQLLYRNILNVLNVLNS